MPKLHSSRQIIKVLERHGFGFVSQRGSHLKYRKRHLTVIVPADKQEIPLGTFRSVLRQSKLTTKHFRK